MKKTIIALAILSTIPAYAQYTNPIPYKTPVIQVVPSDFAAKCAQPGVIKCVGFDTQSDFNTGAGGTQGAYGQNFGIFPPYGTSDYTKSSRDVTIKAGGSSSLKFTIPPQAGSDSSGAWFTNFSSDLQTQFGENSDFYVRWKQRFSPEFITNQYQGAGGWKQIIIGAGDAAGKPFQSSCTALEAVVQNLYQRKFPGMYNSCTGSASHGAYDPFSESFGAYDFKLQNGRASPYCLYSQSSTGYFPPKGNCFGYVANEWMTFQVNIKTGPKVGDEFTNSYVTLWGTREGGQEELIIKWGPYNLTAGNEGLKFGKVWLLPYNTGKSATPVYPEAYTWYDELIISRNKVQP